MLLGFNMLLWTPHVTEEHVPILKALKATGYDGVEIPFFEGDPAHYQKIGRQLCSFWPDFDVLTQVHGRMANFFESFPSIF